MLFCKIASGEIPGLSVAEDVFSACHVSIFVNAVAKKGREMYDLPMFANAWLVHKGDVAGKYPSGGPPVQDARGLALLCSDIDVLCPDIYVPEFLEVCDDYSRNQPLFIPEAATPSPWCRASCSAWM